MGAIEITDTTATTTAAATVTAASADQDALAASLARAAPSAGPVSELELCRLSAVGRLDAVVAWERVVRHAHAGLIRALSALVHVEDVGPGGDDCGGRGSRRADPEGMDLAEMEVCAALAWSPSRAQERLVEAEALTRLFPATVQHLSEGGIALEQARCVVRLTGGLEDAAARAVEARVIVRMPGQRAAVTRQAIRRAVLRADPRAAAQRHRYERARRRVELRPEDDGMATLSFYLPADVAQMALRALTTLAQCAKRATKDSSDRRTLDQRRADLLPVLLHHAATGGGFTGASKPTVPAQVNVVVGIDTLLHLSHEPGHLTGYGPICPEQTRRIAHAHATRWRFLLTATDGTLVDASARTYTPAAAVKRITELRYTTCAFPHCAMPAGRCDLDHNRPHHLGGATSVENLAPLCRTHHNAKSFGHWNLDRQGESVRWTSAHTGRIYTTAATRYEPAPVQPNPGHPAPTAG